MNHREHAARAHRDLLVIDGRVFGLKLLVWLSLLAGGAGLLYHAAAWAVGLGVVITALAMAHGVELQHQALHGTGFRSRRLNHAAGVLLGLPLLISYSQYRDRHLHHHRHVGTPQDDEFFQFRAMGGARRAQRAAALFMGPHWVRVARRMLQALASACGLEGAPVTRSRSERLAQREHLLFVGVVVGAVALAAAGRLTVWPQLVAALACAALVHTLIEWPEHAGCDPVPDPYRNTRSIRSNRLMTWFTNGNNYHVEHHLLPSVPPERLAELHRRIAPQLHFCSGSYRAFVSASLRGWRSGARTEKNA